MSVRVAVVVLFVAMWAGVTGSLYMPNLILGLVLGLTALWLLREHPELDLRRDLPGIIWRYNEASGTANTDSGGYHETITQFYLLALGSCRARLPAGLPLHEQANRVLASRFAARELPLDYWSRERLFSVEARRVWVPPDRAAFDFERIPL